MGSTTKLSVDEAKLAALRAQGLVGAPDRRAGVPGVLRLLGAIQLDTISVLARSQELVPFARLGPIGRAAIHEAYWKHEPGSATAFEYWSHAACVLPVEEWPMMAARRRSFRARGDSWTTQVSRTTIDAIKRRLADEGPLTSAQLGGARKTPGWWDWSEAKAAVERLLACGEVVCVERRGWRRVYDLPERAIPAASLHDDLDDRACTVRMLALAGRALGVGTKADLMDYYRLRFPTADQPRFHELAEAAGLVPTQVAGWGRLDRSGESTRSTAASGSAPAWADPGALAALTESAGSPTAGRTSGGRHRTTLLSPFDSLIWERARTERIFGFTHRLEAYTPKAKRIHGYYAMPLLHGGELIGRVDPVRRGHTLVGRQVTLASARAVRPMARALREAAAWVDCTAVHVDAVSPERLAVPLKSALADLGAL